MESNNLMTIEEAARKGLLKEGVYMDPRAILPDVESRKFVLPPELSGWMGSQTICGEVLPFWNFFVDSEGKWCLLGAPTQNKFWLTLNGEPIGTPNSVCSNLYCNEEHGIIARSMSYEDYRKFRNENRELWRKILRDGGASFLASPSSDSSRGVCIVYFSGYFSNGNYYFGVRPVVSLASDILCDFSEGDGSSKDATIKLVFAN